jgi:hypothetical protein
MSKWNSGFRFLLEIGMLLVLGFWGYKQTGDWQRYLLMVGMPAAAATIWGMFAVKGDPSRSGKTAISTPGIIRLVLELGLFALAAWMLYDTDLKTPSYIYGGAVIVHYAFSYKRIGWLLSHQNSQSDRT